MTQSSLTSNKVLLSAGLGIGVAALSSGYMLFQKYWKKDVIPEKWRRIGTLQHLYLFPVKSCAPLKLSSDTEMLCDTLGLKLDGFRDRCLMLVNEKDEMITARIYPKMVLIETIKVGPTTLLLTAPGMNDLEIDFSLMSQETLSKDIHTSVWGTKVDAMVCGEKYDRWFSQYILGKDSGLKLVYYPYPKPTRTINSRLTKEPYITTDDTGTFNDATSYMLINLESIDDLNQRLPKTIDPLQFRANFYVKMDEPKAFAEDKWGWIRIGDDAIFRVVAPCTRCIFTNINPMTGQRDPDGYPLKMLKSYRSFPGYASPAMGVHLGIRQNGTVKHNDVIYIEDK